MRTITLTSIAVATLLCGFSTDPEPGFDAWGNHVGAGAYTHLSADCETLTRTHGRNAAWGRWEMPLALIVEDGPVEDDRGGISLTFRCRDGSDCIGAGELETVSSRVPDHAISFDTIEHASAFSRRVAELKVACGLAS